MNEQPLLSAEALTRRWQELREGQVSRETSLPEPPGESTGEEMLAMELLPELACDPIGEELLARELPPELFERFEFYGRRVLEANERLNLVSRRDPASQIADNILESLPLLAIWPALLDPLPPDPSVSRETGPIEFILDAGSGSGIPGIPLRLGLESLDVEFLPSLLLVESRKKKAYFLLRLLEELDLPDAEALPYRLESQELEIHLEERGLSRGLLCTRALAEIDQTIRWARPLQSRFVVAHFIKGGPKLRQEFKRDSMKWKKRGWTLRRHEGFHLADRFSEHLTFYCSAENS